MSGIDEVVGRGRSVSSDSSATLGSVGTVKRLLRITGSGGWSSTNGGDVHAERGVQHGEGLHIVFEWMPIQVVEQRVLDADVRAFGTGRGGHTWKPISEFRTMVRRIVASTPSLMNRADWSLTSMPSAKPHTTVPMTSDARSASGLVLVSIALSPGV